jgi:hypothetical protein
VKSQEQDERMIGVKGDLDRNLSMSQLPVHMGLEWWTFSVAQQLRILVKANPIDQLN